MLQVLRCPACHNTLQQGDWQSIRMNVCSGCLGAWVDFADLTAMVQQLTLEAMEAALPDRQTSGSKPENGVEGGARSCPRDGTMLVCHQWQGDSQIVVDYCRSCNGIWLDADELRRYVAFLRDMGDNPPTLTPEIQAEYRRLKMQREADVQAFLADNPSSFLQILGSTLRNVFTGRRR